jgi:anion-transporting  ArsA/GET3 family ATPase
VTERAHPTLRDLAEHKRIIVCCGAGGVGKTTVAASLSLAAARLGRKVLVLTIDPSRRLAQTLGVAQNPPEPVALPADRQEAAGIQPPGSLEAWMLDPKLICDQAVRRFAEKDERSRSILENRIYQQATAIVAGLHEYTAMKALHGFITGGRYDLVVLDTPPSRNALDFLDAPSRLARFFDGGVFKLFLPKGTGVLNRAAGKVITKVLGTVLGDDFAAELRGFLAAFSKLFTTLTSDLKDIRGLLAQNDAAFLLVTTPAEAALAAAHFFHDKILQLGFPFRGFVLNRSAARPGDKVFPDQKVHPPDVSPALLSGLAKMRWLARSEFLQEQRDRGTLADLGLRSGAEAFAVSLPPLSKGASDVNMLNTMAELILTERRSGR